MSECTVLDTFKFKDGTTCTLLSFHKPGEGLVNGREKMLSRGQSNKANMDETAFQKFWKNRDDVPSKWCNSVFVFPETPDSDGAVRFAYRRFGIWRHYPCRLDDDWCGHCVLVLFS